MKNIEKFFVTIALFLLMTTWVLFLYVFAEQNIIILSQKAQVYNSASAIESTKSPIIVNIPPASPSPQIESEFNVLKPVGKFIYPLANSVVSSKVVIKFEVSDSTAVEFYIKRVESSTEIYFGFSSTQLNNTWTYNWDSTYTPNGNYYIIPYISNKYGRYAGSGIYVTVANEVQQLEAEVNQLKEEIENKQISIQNQETQLNQIQNQQQDNYSSEKQKLEQAQNELALKDSDSDGLPDQEEIRIGANPLNSDTDGDGFFDGSEVKLGYDPLSASPADKIVYQNPKEVKALVSEEYKVEKVELVESPQNKNEKVLKIQGKAPANSFVTIYIYSAPTIVVTKADENGNWEYTLDKPLTDGRHTVYASVTNNNGDIEKISNPFDFAKTEDKIIKLLASSGNTESPIQNINRVFIIMIVIAVILAVVFVVLVLGIYLSQHNK